MALASGYSPAHGYSTGAVKKYGPGGFVTKLSANRAGTAQNRLAEAQAKYQMSQIGKEGKLASQGLSALIQSYNQAYGSARSANEERYRRMLGIADQTTGQRLEDIRGAYGQQRSNILQSLGRLGMSGTTIAPTMGMGVDREMHASLNRASDELQQTKLGIMERRTDEYPNINLITSLFSMLGQGMGAGGTSSPGMGRLVNALGGINLG
jgi:hypothetical protein